MAKNGQTKTAAIREALNAATDGGSPTAIAKSLNARGIKVSAQYVSTIKANDKRKAEAGVARRGPGRPPKNRSASEAIRVDLGSASELMLKAMELVVKTGSAKQANQLIDVAASMVARVR